MTLKSPILLLYVLLFAGAYFWLARRRKGSVLAPVAMLLFSIGVYAPWGIAPLMVVLAQAGANCFFVQRMGARPDRRKVLLTLAVGANILLLCWSKYAQLVLGLAGVTGWRFSVPPGLSFLTFVQIAMLVDVGLGRQKVLGWLETLQFQLFFPAMLSGPIARYGNVAPQLAESQRRFSWENASAALFLFSLGLFKKVVLADTLAPLANQGYALTSGLDFLSAWACTLAYTLQIYFDFSGYSDMAIGVARLFGATLPDNFLSPYKAKDIQDFWRRWHITLGLFMRDYVYIPLGGGRRGLVRKCLALLCVFFLVGAWHGVGWTFIVWGCLHGLVMTGHACWRNRSLRMPGWLGWALTFAFVHVAWVFFRAADMPAAMRMLSALSGGEGISLPQSLAHLPALQGQWFRFAGMLPGLNVPWTTLALIPVLLAVCLRLRSSVELLQSFRPGWTSAVITAGAVALGLLYSGGGPQFLYFQF